MKKIKIILLTILLSLNFYNISYSDVEEIPPIENPRSTFTDSEILALQQVALAEAENQGVVGMVYVMQTVINRMNSDKFPNTIIEVIEQPGQFATSSYYKKYKPTKYSEAAFDCLSEVWNAQQLFFERPYKGSWQSTHLCICFTYRNHTFYK